MREPEKMIIYNLFPLLAGPFSAWDAHLERASRMGFNWVFVNPVQRLGASGSLYSIADYFSLNPALLDQGSADSPEDQIRRVTGKARDLGLSMMIDLVINHCAADSPLLRAHPEWFLWDRGKVVNPSAKEDGRTVVWRDLAKFDHKHSRDREGFFRFCASVVEYLIGLGFTGFRCDAAYQVPKSLWERLIRETRKKHPEVRFFAETLGCTPDQTAETARAGFDYVFNSVKWWDFHSHWLMEQYQLTRNVVPSISFPESHDTRRLCDEFNGNVEGMKQRYLFAALFSAGVMMPIGFEHCFRKQLHVIRTKPRDWEDTDIDLTGFISKVNEIKTDHKVFQEEAPTKILPCNNPHVLVMWKACASCHEEALLILNKDIWNKQYFYSDSLQGYLQAGAPLRDISPEYVLDHIPAPFNYDLRPGQGIVLITKRDRVSTD